MESLKYGDIIGTLFKSIPEAKTAHDAWDMPGEALPYIVFSFLEESFFTPIVTSGMLAELCAGIFEFLEQMAASEDTEVKNLLRVGLFETWAANGTLDSSLKHMGPWSKKLAKKEVYALKPRTRLG